MTTLLQRPTLVLNKHWIPVGVRPVNRALCMVWGETAKIVNPDDYSQLTWQDWMAITPADGDEYIQCVGRRIKLPEVITLSNYASVPTRAISFSRRNLFNRDKHICQYCGKHPGSDSLTVDHVMPKSRGGDSSWTNCVLACIDCNFRKANRTPEEAGMKLRRQPVKPKWNPGFHNTRMIPSWEKFVSEMYWNVELEK